MKQGIRGVVDLSVQGNLEAVRQAQLDGIEFSIVRDGLIEPTATNVELKAIRKRAEDLGVEIPSVSSTIPLFHLSMLANDPATVSEGKDVMRRLMEMGRVLGADLLLVIPGVVTSDVNYETAYLRCQDLLLELSDFASTVGIKLGVENVWNRFLLSPLEFRALIDHVARPNVGVYFDIANCVQWGYPEHWLQILNQRIFQVHVKDFKRSVGNIEGFCTLMDGDIDWPRVLDALHEIDYTGYVVAELPAYKHFPTQLFHDVKRWLDMILQGQQEIKQVSG